MYGSCAIDFHPGIFGFSGTLLDTPELFASLFVAATWVLPGLPTGWMIIFAECGRQRKQAQLWSPLSRATTVGQGFFVWRVTGSLVTISKVLILQLLEKDCWNRRYTQSMKSSSLFLILLQAEDVIGGGRCLPSCRFESVGFPVELRTPPRKR